MFIECNGTANLSCFVDTISFKHSSNNTFPWQWYTDYKRSSLRELVHLSSLSVIVFYLWLSNFSARDWKHFRCNVCSYCLTPCSLSKARQGFRHWLRPSSGIPLHWAQVKVTIELATDVDDFLPRPTIVCLNAMLFLHVGSIGCCCVHNASTVPWTSAGQFGRPRGVRGRPWYDLWRPRCVISHPMDVRGLPPGRPPSGRPRDTQFGIDWSLLPSGCPLGVRTAEVQPITARTHYGQEVGLPTVRPKPEVDVP